MRPTAAMTIWTRMARYGPAAARRPAQCAVGGEVGRPHLLDVVELAHFGAEDVDDDVAGIDQNPVDGGRPSIRGLPKPASRRSLTSWSAMAPTCRFERPEVTTMWSASDDLPVMSMATVCFGLGVVEALEHDIDHLGLRPWAPPGGGFLAGEGAIKQCPQPMRDKHGSCVWYCSFAGERVAARSRIGRQDNEGAQFLFRRSLHRVEICASAAGFARAWAVTVSCRAVAEFGRVRADIRPRRNTQAGGLRSARVWASLSSSR